jgi:rubrerythrin
MGWLARLLGTGVTRDLLADLTEDYRAEAAQAAHLRTQADRARYPQVAIALRRLAEIEERHAGWLRNHLISLGGQVPAVEPRPLGGSNQWQRAVAALHDAQAKRRRLVEQIARWDPDEPDVVGLLRRIEEEDTREHEVYEGVIMRSDPQAMD